MADIRSFLFVRHLRAESSSHVLLYRRGSLVKSGRGLSFWFFPMTASIAEVPVDDLRAAVTWLEAQGLRFAPGGIRKGASGHDVCFVHPRGDAAHPRSGEGVLIELVQAPPEVVRAFDAMAAAR